MGVIGVMRRKELQQIGGKDQLLSGRDCWNLMRPMMRKVTGTWLPRAARSSNLVAHAVEKRFSKELVEMRLP